MLALFLVTNKSVQPVNGCHQIIFFCTVLNLYIFCFRSKMTHHLKSLVFDCLSFTDGLITLEFTTDREAPLFIRIATAFALPYHTAV